MTDLKLFGDYILKNITSISDATLIAYLEHLDSTMDYLTKVSYEVHKEILRREP